MKRTWYAMARDKGKSTATIDIFDEIGLFGVYASDFRDELKALGDVTHITLRINSPGGEVFEAAAIFALLQTHPAEVTVQIVGLAASSASFLAMVGDEIEIAENAFMMIHLPSVVAWGDEKELKRALSMLEKVRDQMARAYAKRTGLSVEEVSDKMSEETWLTAEEAVDQGFADEIIGAVRVAAKFDASRMGAIPAEAKALFARRNHKETTMKTGQNKVEETAEEMEARVRAEVTAELKAKADAEAEAKAAAAGKADASKNEGDAASNAVDALRAEMAQIADACALAGYPDKVGEFVAAKKNLTEVMAELKKLVAANPGGGTQTINARNGAGGGVEGTNQDDLGGIDVDSIHAKWNRKAGKR